MLHFESVYLDSGPDIHFSVFDFGFGFIDRNRLVPVAVGLKQMGGGGDTSRGPLHTTKLSLLTGNSTSFFIMGIPLLSGLLFW